VIDLEALYAGPLGDGAPCGVHRGAFLGFVDGVASRRTRAIDTALFVWPRWGVDLDDRRWWFGSPRVRLAAFTLTRARSRWRDAEVYQLHYDRSRLPRAIRRVLYDELKVLPDGRLIGLGGVDGERGHGDHFWYALTPL
jgi:hypothetical protein